MVQHVDAIYEGGILRPLSPLILQDQERVSLSIQNVEGSAPDAAQAATLLDVLNEAGLVGCIKDGPADLSTNPQYMKGFGASGNG